MGMLRAVKCYGVASKQAKPKKQRGGTAQRQPRCSAAEKKFRVDTVYKLLSRDAYSRQQVIEYAAEYFEVGERMAELYMQEAREALAKDADMIRPAWLAEALARLRTYEQSAHKRGQNQVAINALQLQAKLIGMET